MKYLNKRQKYIQEYINGRPQTKVKDIMAYIKGVFSVDRRTIIRDLEILLELKFISKKGAGRGTFYAMSKSYYAFEPIDIDKYFSVEADQREIKEQFDFDIFEVLKETVFTNNEKEELQKLNEEFIKSYSKYESQTVINKEFERILIEFSWKSSKIEGNTYSLLSTERLIKENVPDEDKTDEETHMILNHKDAFNESIQNKEKFINLSRVNIEHIHHLLTKNLDINKNIRSFPVGIVGTRYEPLDNIYQIKDAIELMVDLVNSKKDFFDKAFLTLILLSYIQAFEDGNKRTARMVSNAILLSYNSIPMSYRAVNETKYKEASILFYEQNNVIYFKEIFMSQFEFAVNNYFK